MKIIKSSVFLIFFLQFSTISLSQNKVIDSLENELVINKQKDSRLDKIVSDFSSFSLPSNAMSVSLFLWSTEHSDRKPINNAVLLDIYIEIILEKLNQDNIYRGSFDFTNKLQLLANIAQEMLVVSEENYSLLYSDYIK